MIDLRRAVVLRPDAVHTLEAIEAGAAGAVSLRACGRDARVEASEPDSFRRVRASWSVGTESGEAGRLDLALQALLVSAVRQAGLGPEAVEIDSARALEIRAALGSVDASADVLRSLIVAQTGRRWSVRVGRGRRRDVIDIAALPSRLVAGRMRIDDAATLAVLAGLDVVNPAGAWSLADLFARGRAVDRLLGSAAWRGESRALSSGTIS